MCDQTAQRRHISPLRGESRSSPSCYKHSTTNWLTLAFQWDALLLRNFIVMFVRQQHSKRTSVLSTTTLVTWRNSLFTAS